MTVRRILSPGPAHKSSSTLLRPRRRPLSLWHCLLRLQSYSWLPRLYPLLYSVGIIITPFLSLSSAFFAFFSNKIVFFEENGQKNRSVAIFCILSQSAAAAIFGFPRPFVRFRYFKRHPFFCTGHTRFTSVFRLHPVKKTVYKMLDNLFFIMYSDCKR